MNESDTKDPSAAAKQLSLLGAAKGGEARAKKLSSERRREIARAAIQARWERVGKIPPPQATHKGNFKDDFGMDVDCYVLNDETRTAVISQRGMGAALKLGEGGSGLPRFVAGKKVSEALGVDVTILIDVCKAIVKAESEGRLLKSQANITKQAHVILNASAKAGIKGLVYALAGYDATREDVIAAFKFYVREEAREYEKEFPGQLYQEWYRLYRLPKPERNKPWKFMHLTVDQVYWPLAKSNGKILELTRIQRESSKARWKRLHQFLSDIGVKALRTQLGQLLGIARISKSKHEYEQHFQTLFGDQGSLSFEEPKK